AGGTQRLPRLVGVAHALDMIAGGDAIDAVTAAQWGLVDEVCAGELRSAAAACALRAAGRPLADRVVGARTVAAPEDARVYERARAQAARRYRGCEAPLACVDCVERAASASLSEGLAYERERFLGLVNGDQSKALRHL